MTDTYTIPKRIVEIIRAGRAWVKALKDADEAKYSRDHDAKVAIAGSALRHLRALFEDDETIG